MSIRREQLAFERRYVQIPNEWLRDQRLSRRARGLLAEIMTHEVGWEITIESLVEKGPEGRDAIRGAIQEMETCGYLRRERQKVGGRLRGMDYVLQSPDNVEQVRISSVGNSSVGNSYVGGSATKKTSVKEDHQEEDQEKRERPRKRVRSPLPAEFTVKEDLWTWAQTQAPGTDLDLETKKFVDYYLSKGAVSADWDAMWRKWILRAVEYTRVHPAEPQKQPWF